MISAIYVLGNRFWDGIVKHAKGNTLFNDIELDLWDVVRCFKEDKNLSGNGFRAAKRVLGMIESNAVNVEEVTALSQLPESRPFDYKAIYDRMSALAKKDWDSIYRARRKDKDV